MESIDVATSDKVQDVGLYGDMDRDLATPVDILQRESSPSGKAMDRQREAQEYIRSRRAQATVVDETDDEIIVDAVAPFAKTQNASRDTEADEQKLLASLASKYKYNLYQSNSAQTGETKLPENTGSPIKSEQTHVVVQPHRKEHFSSSQTRQTSEGHDPWQRSHSKNRSISPPHGNPQRTPSPSVDQTESTQITPSPPPPIPTAPINDFHPGPVFPTSQMPYSTQHARPTYTTNLRQYQDRSSRLPPTKLIAERSINEHSMAGSGHPSTGDGHLSERYRHNQISVPQVSKSHSPKTITQWAAPKPARATSNLVQNLQDSQVLQIAESPQTSRAPSDSYTSHAGQDLSRQGMDQSHEPAHHGSSGLWNPQHRIPQQNFSPPDSLSSNSRRQMAYGYQNNSHGRHEAYVHAQPAHGSHLQPGHHGNHNREPYSMSEQGSRSYGYDNHAQDTFSTQTTLANQSNFTPTSHGNSGRGHAPDYQPDHHFEPGLDGRRPQLHGSMSSPTMHRDLNSVDWRAQLCQLFDAPHESQDEELFKMLEISRSKLALPENPDTESGRFSMPYHTIHRVTCLARQSTELYLDTPWVVHDGSGVSHIHGSIVVRNVALHMKQYTNLAFIVYKTYTCCSIPPGLVRQIPPGGTAIAQFLASESVCLISEELSAGLKRLTRQNIHENPYYPSFNIGTEFEAPYPWFYNQRAHLEERRRQLKPELLSRVNSFVEYVNDSFGEEYAVVDSLLNKGMISPKYLKYLYSPDTVVLRAKKNEVGSRKKAFLTKSWLLPGPQDQSIPSGDLNQSLTLSLSVSSWTFDGAFHEVIETIAIECPKNPDEIIKVPSLAIYPIRFADSAIAIALRKQGEMFWKLRRGGYVYYSDDDGINENVGQSRYMIDVETYNKLHPELRETNSPNKDELGHAAMASDTPPDGVFTLLLPNRIVGFSMQEKKWMHLEVSRIYPIKWDKEAFETLAVDDNTKVLVTALVANQITEEQNPGVGGGKANGSIVLLHGGSGTGKTLTAESVAEIVEKPLYRVDCSDLGATPEIVAKTLEHILHLGKLWNCVILLEEAELFLEKRTLGDLQRNALVSVFLRAIESYTGMSPQPNSAQFHPFHH
ncbi:hypothetical protein ACMFMG_009461 [Clarireedia jacksonii]